MKCTSVYSRGCNSIVTFLSPELGQKPGASHVWSFDTCLNLKCPSTEFGPELGSLLCPGLHQKFKMSTELTPRSPQCNHQPTQTPSQLLHPPRLPEVTPRGHFKLSPSYKSHPSKLASRICTIPSSNFARGGFVRGHPSQVKLENTM